MGAFFAFTQKVYARDAGSAIYPLRITLSLDKQKVVNDGKDSAVITIRVLDSGGVGVENVSVDLAKENKSDIILPKMTATDSDGLARFQIRSLDEHTSTFQFALQNPDTGEIYSSNLISVEFFDPTPFREMATVQLVANNIILPLTVASLAIGLYGTVISFINSFLPFLNYLFNLILQLFGIRRKEKPWGVVYDSMTKEPVDLAIVRLFDAKTNALRQTIVTDKGGRFGFQPERGRYHITVTKRTYGFPSRLIKGSAVDGSYHDLYFGNDITIASKKSLNISVPLDLITAIEARVTVLDRLKGLFGTIALPVLVISFALSIFVLWVSTTAVNGAICGLYVLTLIIRRRSSKSSSKPWGKVFDVGTSRPVAGVPIKVFDKKYNKLLETRVSDQLGRFSFLLPKGEYYMRLASFRYQIAKKSQIKSDIDNYFGDNFEVKEGQPTLFNIPVTDSGSK